MAKTKKNAEAGYASFLEMLTRRLRKAPTVVYDSETTGLDFRMDYIVGHVLTFSADPRESFYVAVRHTGGGNIPGDLALRFEKEVAKIARERTDLRWVFHNGAFDLRFMFRNGDMNPGSEAIKPSGPIEDTMINAPLIDEYQRSFSLEYCCNVYKVQAKRGDAIKDYLCDKFKIPEDQRKGAMGHFHKLAGDDPMAVEYATGDGTSTWQLREEQHKALDAMELRTVWGVESRLIPVLNEMTMHGVKIDEERLQWVLLEVDRRIAEARKKLPRGLEEVRKSDQLEKAFRDAGHIDWPTTPAKGLPSFKEEWLKTNPLGQAVLVVRKYEHLKNSFLIPLIERHVFKGRIHATFNQLRNDEFGTLTGRLSSNDPNLQQIHKRNEELGRLIRSFFIPDEGKIWESADYSQCEPRLLAFYSRCPALMEDYRTNPKADAHAAIAKAAGIDRESGKRANQLIITGGGAKTMAAKHGLPLEQAQEIMRRYFAANPEVKQFQKRAEYRIRQRGYIVSLLGRRAHVHDVTKAYRGANRALQCGNADILKLKMVEVADYIKSSGADIQMLINAHDATENQRSPGAEKHYRECLRIMEDFSPGQLIELDVPMKVDSKSGPNWAIATYGEEGKKDKAA